MEWFEYLMLIIAVLAGGWLGFRFSDQSGRWLKLALSFSGSYILGMTVLHLMPGVFESGGHSAGAWVLAGFFVQLLLEQFSRGVEHGHIHAHHSRPRTLAIQVMAGLSLHAFLEGMPLGYFEDFHTAHHHHHEGSLQFLVGILLHKIPAAFALMALLLRAGLPHKTVWGCLAGFALMSPAGAFTASYLQLGSEGITFLLAFVIGAFLHISTTILFEADDTHEHRISMAKLLVILFGVGLSIVADII